MEARASIVIKLEVQGSPSNSEEWKHRLESHTSIVKCPNAELDTNQCWPPCFSSSSSQSLAPIGPVYPCKNTDFFW